MNKDIKIAQEYLPKGYIISPLEPTDEMLEAAHNVATFGNMDLIKDEIEAIYSAMIAVNKEKV